jgi:hypothetical protein
MSEEKPTTQTTTMEGEHKTLAQKTGEILHKALDVTILDTHPTNVDGAIHVEHMAQDVAHGHLKKKKEGE